ncbi:CDP-diacylglycerol--glycerol-3-phosphate 3-phosphatidyltransferase [Deltaproteobacteria bacterium]|nr:CDP-diacylglycerol--glycerol-3-phosphate 3-phosphatidyltransferase [Deltaproteobacteria bacterium]
MSTRPWYRRPGFTNLPMLITLGRCAAVPVMVAILWETPGPLRAIVAMFIFVTAMVGDVVDGWLARKWDVQSVAGAFLDPIADKLMVLATLVMLIPLGWVPAWIVLVLEGRELLIGALRQIAVSEGLVIAAGSLGKFKTAYQSTAIGFLLFHYQGLNVDFRPFGLDMQWPGIDAHTVGIVLLWQSMVLSVASAFTYSRDFYKHHQSRKQATEP